MIKGANYKAREGKNAVRNNDFGWDFAKVLEVRSTRTVNWVPTSDREDGQYTYFWRSMPNGDIKSIVDMHETFVVYFYSTKSEPNATDRAIVEINSEEFHEAFNYSYDLISVDGVTEEQF